MFKILVNGPILCLSNATETSVLVALGALWWLQTQPGIGRTGPTLHVMSNITDLTAAPGCPPVLVSPHWQLEQRWCQVSAGKSGGHWNKIEGKLGLGTGRV